MFIQTEETPNPSALKFIPGPHLVDMSLDFPSVATARQSPLALRLFSIEGVKSIFIAPEFITVTKDDEKSWDQLRPILSGAIYEHLGAGKPILTPEDTTHTDDPSESNVEDEGVVKDIKDILNNRVRPAVAQDGGDIVFNRFEDGVVYLQLKGACSGCPSSTITLKSGIENMLRYYVPEVTEVRSIDE